MDDEFVHMLIVGVGSALVIGCALFLYAYSKLSGF
jgi:hypothetical protein